MAQEFNFILVFQLFWGICVWEAGLSCSIKIYEMNVKALMLFQVQPGPPPCPVFCMEQPEVVLPPDGFWVLRFPYSYATEHGPCFPPKENQPLNHFKVLRGILRAATANPPPPWTPEDVRCTNKSNQSALVLVLGRKVTSGAPTRFEPAARLLCGTSSSVLLIVRISDQKTGLCGVSWSLNQMSRFSSKFAWNFWRRFNVCSPRRSTDLIRSRCVSVAVT